MNIMVHSKTVPVTEAMRGFIAKQADKFGKLSQPIESLRVFLENRKNHEGVSLESKVNVQVKVRGKDIVTSAKAANLYTAVHEAMHDALRSLRKRKERFTTKRALRRRMTKIEKSGMAMT